MFKKFSSHISTVTLIYLSLTSVAAFAQQRVVEDSLVYDDPTVAKPGKWLFGVGVDYYNWSKQTSFGAYTETQKVSQPGISAWTGYEDFTLLMSYKQGYGTTYYPGNAGGFRSDNQDIDITLRYLIMPLSKKYFVPYILAGYTDMTIKDTQYSNATIVTKTFFKAPSIGIGGIIPVTEKYGFRADYKRYKGTSSSSSNDPNDQFVPWTQMIRITATAYYNISENINFQVGARTEYFQSISQSTQTGGYASLGYSF